MPIDTLTRRQLIRAANGLGIAALLGQTPLAAFDESKPAISAKDAIARLKSGNKRFVTGKVRHNHTSQKWRESLVAGQNPFAVILSCADSRVPTELVFDQGFGDLFVIRNAGNIMSEEVMGSVEYAGLHLKTQLVVIMGHEGCGAVTAALKSREERAKEPPELQQVLRFIDPALKHLDPTDQDAVPKGVEANVRWTVKMANRIKKERAHPASKQFMFAGAVYDLKSGKVRFLSESKK